MLIENSVLNTVTKERKQTCFLCVRFLSFLWFGEREPGPIIGCNKCVNFVCYVNYAAFRRCLVNEDNQILHKVPAGVLWKAAFTGLPRSRVFMFFQNPWALLGFSVILGSLIGRTLGFPFKLHSKQLISVVHGKISQSFQMVEERFWYVKNTHLELALQSSHLTPHLWELAPCLPVFLSNLSCLKLKNYQVECYSLEVVCESSMIGFPL